MALLGIGGAGYAMARSRRRDADEPVLREDVAPYEPAPHEPVATAHAPAAIDRPEPVDAETRETAFVAPAAAATLTAPTLGRRIQEQRPVAAPTPAPVARRDDDGRAAPALQGAGPVPMGEDRHDLLMRMVDAEPDAQNPFRSRKARLRRARLILQHREHLQTEGKPFDWRTYRPTMERPAGTPTRASVDENTRTPEYAPA